MLFTISCNMWTFVRLMLWYVTVCRYYAVFGLWTILKTSNKWWSNNLFVGEIPSYISHYISPREETPACVTNQQRL